MDETKTLPEKRKRPPVPKSGKRGIDISKRIFNPRRGRYEIPLETMVALRNTGELSIPSIAKILGCSTQHVAKRLSETDARLRAVPSYRKAKSDLLALKEASLMGHMTEKKMQVAPLKDVAVALNIVHGIGRLEDGKSTSNVATYAQSRLKEEESQDVVRRTEKELKQLIEENPHYAEMDYEEAPAETGSQPEDDLQWLE
jgi:hypothetical protein